MGMGLGIVLLALGLAQAQTQAQTQAEMKKTFACGNQVQLESISPTRHEVPDTRLSQDRLEHLLEQIIEIPVIVHLVHHPDHNPGESSNLSTRQVQSQIDALNRDFRATQGGHDTKIQFCPARVDPMNRTLPEPGIHRISYPVQTYAPLEYVLQEDIETKLKPSSIWDPRSYLNIWVVPGIDLHFFGIIFGYSTFPVGTGLPGLDSNGSWIAPSSTFSTPQNDGIVIHSRVFGSNDFQGGGFDLYPGNERGKVTTHEVGHWLGLFHTFQGNTCGPLSEGDFCRDTPPTRIESYGCPGPLIQCDQTTMTENFMDYTDDACKWRFTPDQVIRMKTTLALGAMRSDLPQSGKCHPDAKQSGKDYLIFPNPAKDHVQIRIMNDNLVRVSIHDSLGRTLFQKSLDGPVTTLMINVADFQAGAYNLLFERKDGNVIHDRLLKVL
jgi:hypothetical protein